MNRSNKIPRAERVSAEERCCATYVLSQEPDFLAQREWLVEVVNGFGMDVIYYPKYHCELNFIEMIWCWVKAYLRTNTTYRSSAYLKQLSLGLGL